MSYDSLFFVYWLFLIRIFKFERIAFNRVQHTRPANTVRPYSTTIHKIYESATVPSVTVSLVSLNKSVMHQIAESPTRM